MDWKNILDIVINVVGGILAIPFLFGILIALLAIILYCFKLIAIIVDFIFRIFKVETKLENIVANTIIQFIDFFLSIPVLLKRTWKISKIIIGILFILSIWLTPLILNHCSPSYHSGESEYDDDYYEPGKLRPDKF